MALTPVADSYSPIYQGDTLIPFMPQFAQYVNGVLQAYPLAGLTLSLKMQLENDPSIVHAGAGTWTIDSASQGQAHYTYDSSDVATPGVWTLFVKLTNSSTGAFVHAFTKPLEILSVPS
jgi:hypothetical protein